MKHIYGSVFNELNLAYVSGRIIYDLAGNRIDIEFIEVNAAFEELTGHTAIELIGNNGSEFLDIAGSFKYEISEFLSDIKELSNKKEFERYKPTQNKWYRFHTYSFENDILVVIIADITNEINERTEKMLMYVAINGMVLAISPDMKISNIISGNNTNIFSLNDPYVGENILDLFIDDDSGKLLLTTLKALTSSKEQVRDVSFSSSGQEKWYRISIQNSELIPNNSKIISIEDVTEIKQLAKEKQENEQLLSAVFNASDDAMFLLNGMDMDNIYYIMNNDLHKNLMDMDIKDDCVTCLEDYWDDEQAELFKEKIKICMQSGSRVTYEREIYLNDTDKTILTSLTPLYRGEKLAYILGTRKDISQTRQIEKQIKNMEQRDPITGLYNRLFFESALKLYDREEYLPLTVIIGDVEGIKLTNNAFGYGEGYALLKSIASVMMGLINSNNVVARISENRFGMILTNTTSNDAEKLIKNVSAGLLTQESKGIRTL